MKVGSILKRESDGALFKVVDLGHWSSIKQVDGPESFVVKWMGSDLYVGVHGPTFQLLPEKK